MMSGMRLMIAVGLAAVAGCAREPHYGFYGKTPHEWVLAGPDYDVQVFGPMPSEDTEQFVRDREAEGWELIRYEEASEREDVMVNSGELDLPSRAKRRWTFDLPKTHDPSLDAPRKRTIPPYLEEDVTPHRQKYLLSMRRWK
jgi:hypothetical protein